MTKDYRRRIFLVIRSRNSAFSNEGDEMYDCGGNNKACTVFRLINLCGQKMNAINVLAGTMVLLR
mgnify:CR=1 FL=1